MGIQKYAMSLDTSGVLITPEYLFDIEQVACKMLTDMDESGAKIRIDASNINNTFKVKDASGSVVNTSDIEVSNTAAKVGILTYNSYSFRNNKTEEEPLFISSSVEKRKPLLDWLTPINSTLDFEDSGIIAFINSEDPLMEFKPSFFNETFNNKVYRGSALKIIRDINSGIYLSTKSTLKTILENFRVEYNKLISEGSIPPQSLVDDMNLAEQKYLNAFKIRLSLDIADGKLPVDMTNLNIAFRTTNSTYKVTALDALGAELSTITLDSNDDFIVSDISFSIPKTTVELKIEEEGGKFDETASLEIFGVYEGELEIQNKDKWEYLVPNSASMPGRAEVHGKEYDFRKDYLGYSYTEGITFHEDFLSSEANLSGFYKIKINQPTMTSTTEETINPDLHMPSKKFLDGLYTSYVLVVPIYDANTVYSINHIVYYNNKFWANTTGWNLTIPTVIDPEQPVGYTDWEEVVEFSQWRNYMKLLTRSLANNNGMYAETQHLVTTTSQLTIQDEIEKVSNLIYQENYTDLSFKTSLELTKLKFLSEEQFLDEGFTECSRYINDIRIFLLTKDKVK